MSPEALTAILDAWDPDAEDLPSEVARAMDADPSLRAVFDRHFAPTDLPLEPVDVSVAERLMPRRRRHWIWRRTAWHALAAAMLVAVLPPLFLSRVDYGEFMFFASPELHGDGPPVVPTSPGWTEGRRNGRGRERARGSKAGAMSFELPPPPRRLPHRRTQYTQPPPGGQLQFQAINAARRRQCAQAMDAVTLGMTTISPDHATLYKGAWLCFNEAHQRKLEQASVSLETLHTALRHLEGPVLERLAADPEVVSWARPAADGLEARLERFGSAEPWMEEVLSDLFTEQRLADDLAKDVLMEAGLASWLSQQSQTPLVVDALARRVYVSRRALSTRIGRLLDEHRGEVVPTVLAQLAQVEARSTAVEVLEAARAGAGPVPTRRPDRVWIVGQDGWVQVQWPDGQQLELDPADRFLAELGWEGPPRPELAHGFTSTADDPRSTFAADVDTASFATARAFLLGDGARPDPADVRIEELVNALPYDVVPATASLPFSVRTEIGPAPWSADERVLRIQVQGRRLPPAERPRLHATFLVDTSGSMQSENRLGLAQRALVELVDELEPDDTVAILTFSEAAQEVLRPTPARDAAAIREAIYALVPDGSTAMDAGLRMAYDRALARAEEGAENRVVLVSDGGANVGITDAGGLLGLVRDHADRGITLTSLAFGAEGSGDPLMEQLADRGDGNHHAIWDMADARRVLVYGMTGSFHALARDVKLQVAFDPERVGSWRQIAYENRQVADHLFRDDTVDGGEVGSGHQVTALYRLRDVSEGGALGSLSIRWEAPGPQGVGREHAYAIVPKTVSTADHRMALAAAMLGAKLRSDAWVSGLSDADLLDWVQGAMRPEHPIDRELEAMVEAWLTPR